MNQLAPRVAPSAKVEIQMRGNVHIDCGLASRSSNPTILKQFDLVSRTKRQSKRACGIIILYRTSLQITRHGELTSVGFDCRNCQQPPCNPTAPATPITTLSPTMPDVCTATEILWKHRSSGKPPHEPAQSPLFVPTCPPETMCSPRFMRCV